MIDKDYGYNSLSCDICGEYAEENGEIKLFDYFHEAVEYKKRNGWRSKKGDNGQWQDVCPDCQE